MTEQKEVEEQKQLVTAKTSPTNIKYFQTTYESWRRTIFYFMERPETTVAVTFHLVNLLLIVSSIVISVLSTVDVYENDPSMMTMILYYEIALLAWFTIEYILRAWSCSFLHKYKGCMGMLRFMKTLYMLIDGFVIVSTLVTVILQVKTTYFSILRITRFLQIFRILRLDRQRGDLRTMGKVVYKHRKELVTCYFVGFIILFGGTYIVYVIEKLDFQEGSIDNMANGLYWAMITVTSVGYGDFSPKTWAGKLITGVFALVGCAFFALPAGILGSGFALQVAKQRKQKRYIKVRNPAALVIQTCWRNYALKNHQFHLQATWLFYFPQVMRSRHELNENLAGINEVLTSEGAQSLTPNTNTQQSSKNRKRITAPPSSPKVRGKTKKSNEERRMVEQERKNGTLIPLSSLIKKDSQMFLELPGQKPRKRGSFRKKSSAEAKPLSTLLSPKYKAVLRFLVRVRFWNSVKNFKNIRYPFVNVQDIMEKNALSHMEVLSHLNEIQKCMLEFRSEMQSMKRTMNEIQLRQIHPQWRGEVMEKTTDEDDTDQLFVGIDEELQSISSDDKVTDIDTSL